MVEKTSINIMKAKRLPKGQCMHARRLKQAARKERIISNPKH